MPDPDRSPAAPDPHHDAAAFLWSVGGDRLVREMVALFVAYTPNRIAAMHAAAQRCDARGLSREAFALRAAAMQLGLHEVERAAASIEGAMRHHATSGDGAVGSGAPEGGAPGIGAPDAGRLLADLETAYAAAVQRLQPADARVA